MNRKTFVRSLAMGALLSIALLAGCRNDLPTTSIKTLLDDPGQYDKKTVHVAGTVGSSVGIMGYGAYTLEDGTGSITVVTKEGGAPREGVKVGVEGEFRSAFTLGLRTAAVIVESSRVTQ